MNQRYARLNNKPVLDLNLSDQQRTQLLDCWRFAFYEGICQGLKDFLEKKLDEKEKKKARKKKHKNCRKRKELKNLGGFFVICNGFTVC